MVCSLGSGRMAVMARILGARSYSQNVAGYVHNQKLAAQFICKEIIESDEPNLLDQEDMDVFGLKPMEDPLYLVCCNACKKPVKASRYAAHAELCRYASNIGETVLELNCGTEIRKPPQKERRKLVSAYTNQAAPVRKQDQWHSMNANDYSTSEINMDGQVDVKSFKNVKGNSCCIDVASVMDDSGAWPTKTGYSAFMLPSSTQRSKLIAGGSSSLMDNTEVDSSVTEVRSYRGTETYFPAPLATKIYYSQRNNRLRAEISHMFHATETKEPQDNDVLEAAKQEMMQPQRGSSPGQDSDVSVMTSAGREPADNLSNQLSVDEAARHKVASTKSPRYRDIPLSFV